VVGGGWARLRWGWNKRINSGNKSAGEKWLQKPNHWDPVFAFDDDIV
jgi:hypothetical protein